jgi:hypothetical protein
VEKNADLFTRSDVVLDLVEHGGAFAGMRRVDIEELDTDPGGTEIGYDLFDVAHRRLPVEMDAEHVVSGLGERSRRRLAKSAGSPEHEYPVRHAALLPARSFPKMKPDRRPQKVPERSGPCYIPSRGLESPPR